MSDQPSYIDWRNLALHGAGRSLIEASAGTGKTWTIAALYLRLILEQTLSPRRIVVTTFTDAAASELRERLRARLLWAEREALLFDAHTPSADDATDKIWLHDRWRDDAQREADLGRLRLALSELDLAPISTLHGLCARILAEHPFAAGGRFVQGELVDGVAWYNDIAADLRRILDQSDAAELEAFLPAHLRLYLPNKINGKQIGQLLAPGSEVPDIALPDWPDTDTSQALRDGARTGVFRAGSVQPKAWLAAAEFIESRGQSAIDAKQLKTMQLADGLIGVLNNMADDPALLKAQALSAQAADFIKRYFDAQRQHLWQRLRGWAIVQKRRQAERHDQRSFDDLIGDVDAALASEQGRAARPLADALHAAWPLALVDEFQDTDGVQYAILDAIYRDTDGAPRGRLVMIGDPKQAIYRFRGGDIHTYQRASASAPPDGQLRLGVNHRSSRAMVAAINELYEITGDALDARADATSAIRYHPVEASTRRDATPLRLDGQPLLQPLRMVIDPDPPDASGERTERALESCANEITAMLASGRYSLIEDDEPRLLNPADIAVLLPNNFQILTLRGLLEARHVPCVSMARSSVFAGETARELQLILHAVAHAEQQAPMRAALATGLFGMSLSQVAALDGDVAAWQAFSVLFHRWRGIWQTLGAQALIDALIERIGARVLAEAGGERILTDLRHLGEELQTAANEGLGQAALLEWLAGQRANETDGEENAAESRQLRIESESKRVQLMTLHASKGLEFAVVFLPLMWAHEGKPETGLVALNDPQSGHRLLRADDAAAKIVAEELQDERFRVLYVALTRAIHACHVQMLPVDRPVNAKSQSKTVADAGSTRSALDVMLGRSSPPLDHLLQAADSPHISWETGWNHDDSVRYHATRSAPQQAQARQLPALPWSPLPSLHSFSSLMRGVQAADGTKEGAAEDEDLLASANRDSSADGNPVLKELADWRGAEFGTALHGVFENREIGRPVAEQGGLIQRELQRQSLWNNDRDGKRLAALLGERIDAVLATPLAQDMPALGELPGSDLLAEMQFHFAIDAVSLGKLRAICAAHGEPELVPANDRQLRGLMTGKIDLILRHDGRYHVLDYKGNYLETELENYQPAALRRAMDAANYRFQALLYILALDRHLRLRLPGYARERHLGDAWYLFVRAVGLGGDAGIWRHRFADGLLDDLQAAFGVANSEEAA